MKLDNTLNLIIQIINLGGTLLPLALAAYAEIKAESGMTDEEILARATELNAANRERLLEIINGSQ